jgi:hypothetical protein
MPYAKEQILEAFKKLPEDVKEAMFSIDTVEIMRQIGEKHKLMIDKIGELADETGLVMLGLTHPSQFISHLTDRLEIDKTIAKEIAEEINSKVFFPIRENLKKIHGVEAGEAKEEIPPLPIPEVSAPPLTAGPEVFAPMPEIPPAEAPISALSVEPISEIPTPEAPKPEQTPATTPGFVAPIKAPPQEIKKVDPYREPIV